MVSIRRRERIRRIIRGGERIRGLECGNIKGNGVKPKGKDKRKKKGNNKGASKGRYGGNIKTRK